MNSPGMSYADLGISHCPLGQIESQGYCKDHPLNSYASINQDTFATTCAECGEGIFCDVPLSQCRPCEDGKYYENSTKLCVSRCPDNSWGDTTPLRICVATCSYGKYMQNSTLECVSYVNCRELFLRNRASPDGVYFISPAPGIIIETFCNISSQGVTLFQKRVDASTNFTQDWATYQKGFGNPATNLWLGLDNMYALVNSKISTLVIKVTFEGNTYFGFYEGFSLGDANAKYIINWNSRNSSSNLVDYNTIHGFVKQKMKPFSTYNFDNDETTVNCAELYLSG